jgi:hypothetical protein
MKPLPIFFVTTLYLGGCAAQAVTSGRVAVRDDRPAAAPKPAPASSENAAPAASPRFNDRAAPSLRFSDRDRVVVAEYYQTRKPKAAPGAAKRAALTAGLARGAKLPAGAQGRSLPRELEARLGAPPADTVRLVVARDVVLMERKTHLVRDILYGVAE